jgi:hypothetical protein
MTHAALVNDVVFWLVVVMTVLLVMFIYAVITAPRQDAAPAEPPVLEPSALEWTAPASALPTQRSLASASPAGVTGQPGGTGYPARHAPAAAPVISPAKVSSGRRWGPVGASILAAAGLVITVVGAGMFVGTGHAVKACSHQAAAVCLDGFVLLDAAQLLGGVIALAGIGLIVTAIVVALR